MVIIGLVSAKPFFIYLYHIFSLSFFLVFPMVKVHFLNFGGKVILCTFFFWCSLINKTGTYINFFLIRISDHESKD